LTTVRTPVFPEASSTGASFRPLIIRLSLLLAAVLDSPVSLLPTLNFFVKLEKVLDVVRRSVGELLDASLLLLLSFEALGLDVMVGVHAEAPSRPGLIKSWLEER
jgi:hypothetical protein